MFWHAGSVLALPEAGIPSRYSRFLEPEEFGGGLTVPVASHVHRLASDGGRVLFGVDDGTSGDDGIFLRLGEWDAGGALRQAQSVPLERATWQHDIGVTAEHIVFLESPTTRLPAGPAEASGSPVPFGWVPGSEGWLGVVRRDRVATDAAGVRWIRLDPGLVTHVLGAFDEPDGSIVMYACCYGAPEAGQPIDHTLSVMGRAGLALSGIGGTLAMLERWRITGERVERVQIDERSVEYPRMDALCEGGSFRYGYTVETAWADVPARGGAAATAAATAATSATSATSTGLPDRPDPWTAEAAPVGLLQFDLARDEVAGWNPGPGRTPGEPLFVRARDGRGDDEGWLLSVVDDANRGASDVYVLDASSFGRRRPEAVIHLPVRLPVRSHGEWVPADRYR